MTTHDIPDTLKGPDPLTEQVAEKIANEKPAEEMNPGFGLYVFLPTPGWMVQQPAQQDPQKRNGDMVESPWLPAFGVTAESYGAAGLRMYGVLVLFPDGQQTVVEHEGLHWAPLQIAPAPPLPENMRPIHQGA